MELYLVFIFISVAHLSFRLLETGYQFFQLAYAPASFYFSEPVSFTRVQFFNRVMQYSRYTEQNNYAFS
jgi:hypothetical protein